MPVKLKSSDDKLFEVEQSVAFMSSVIKTMFQDLGEDDEMEIPLLNVDGFTLEKVLVWAEKHKDDPSKGEDESKDNQIDLNQWEVDYLKVDQPTLFSLILAANYLDIQGLLDLTCKNVAMMIKGKTPEEIRFMFNIRNDLSDAEIDQIRKENEWCDEK